MLTDKDNKILNTFKGILQTINLIENELEDTDKELDQFLMAMYYYKLAQLAEESNKLLAEKYDQLMAKDQTRNMLEKIDFWGEKDGDYSVD